MTPLTVAYQALPSMGFSRQGYWSGVPFPSPEDLPDPWIEPKSPVSPALATRFFTTKPVGKPINDMLPYTVRTYCIAQGTLLNTL